MDIKETNETDEKPTAGSVPADVGGPAEAEALKAENESLRDLLRVRDARDAIVQRLRSAGARSPGLLFAYAVDSLQFDTEGKLENEEAILAHLRSSFPEQFTAGPAGSVTGGVSDGRQNAAGLTKEKLAKMSPAEIAKLDWDVVAGVMRNN
jgi:hypothetical protein